MPNIAADDTALSLNPITSESQPKRAFQREATDTRTKRVLMVGYGKTAQKLHQRIKQQRRFSHHIVTIHEPDETHAIDSDIERLRNTEQISDAIVRHAISEVWIALPFAEISRWHQLQPLLCQLFVDLRWVPDTDTMTILSHRYRDLLGIPVVDLNHPKNTGLRGLCKMLFDRGFALGVLILLLPLFAVLSLAIKCSSLGPVFFTQSRLGLNGKRFDVYKFRSMKLHQESDGNLTQATRNDPRITPIGRFMRRTSLDELPQFINVLKGEMSVVGPRPHALIHNDLYKDKLMMYMQRHRVKPGITGWAQINGCRGETDTEEKMASRIALDLHYIRNWSFSMDLKIILWTAFKGWTDTNAY
jgi:putative colanic acid biosynthesis UDP-glucose lipid carrier transferase